MSKHPKNSSLIEKIATFIVDKRNLVFFLYAIALIVCVFTRSLVQVSNDLTDFLPSDTETRRGISVMSDELKTYGTARVMVSHVTYETAQELSEQLRNVDMVSSVVFDGTEDHYKGAEALFDINFRGEDSDPAVKEAMDNVRSLLEPYDTYIDTSINVSLEDTLNSEMSVIFMIAVIIIIFVLVLTSRSYAEIPVLLITFGAAALLNMGTNYWYGEISFVSNSVAVLLQLALAIDYAIIFLHRCTEEQTRYDDREACIAALTHAIPAISASSLTTVSGLLAMTFMQFRIGFDMGIVLIKAILFSMLSVFTLMPGLLMLFSRAISRTRHKDFIPKIDGWGRFVVKTRKIGVPLFTVCLVAGFILCSRCPYVYSYSSIESSRRNEAQIAQDRIEETFGVRNVMALVVPRGDYESERQLLARLSQYSEVNSAMGLANVEALDGYTLTDSLTPREFSEMTDMDYETIALLYAAYAVHDEDYGKILGSLDSYRVPLMDMFFFLCEQKKDGVVTLDDEMSEQLDAMYDQLTFARDQMQGEHYSRMIIDLNLPLEGEETFAFLKTIHQEAERYYDPGQVFLVGESTSACDLAASFSTDNIMISVLSVIFVVMVLLFTFQSVGLPVLLILVIQGSIWINFSYFTVTKTPIFFMAYLIGVAIQMGANIDYAIVISSRYADMKKLMPPKEAAREALSLAFPTVFTSGAILSSATFLVSVISTEPSIVSMCSCLCRGTLISVFLVMFVLPQFLLLGDALVQKTKFQINLKKPAQTRSEKGRVYVDGHIRGTVSGYVDAYIHGTIEGGVTGTLGSGSMETEKEAGKHEEN